MRSASMTIPERDESRKLYALRTMTLALCGAPDVDEDAM